MSNDENVQRLLALLTRYTEIAVQFTLEKGPAVEAFLFEVVELLFHPKQVLRQLVTISALQVVVLLGQFSHGIYTKIARRLTASGRREEELMARLRTAPTYEQWQDLAQQLDALHGHNKWREIEASPLYDSRMVKKRIKAMEYMLRRGDVFNLIFRLRGGMARDQFGLQHTGLFSRAKAGTKLLVERYSETVSAALDFICDSPIADEEVSRCCRSSCYSGDSSSSSLRSVPFPYKSSLLCLFLRLCLRVVVNAYDLCRYRLMRNWRFSTRPGMHTDAPPYCKYLRIRFMHACIKRILLHPQQH